MATTQNALIGRASGSVGGVTFSSWKGKNVIRAKAVSVANPNTAAQQTARAILANAVFLFRLVTDILNAGFSSMAIGKSAYNAFVAENVKNGSLDGDPVDTIAVVPLFVVSKGSQAATPVTRNGFAAAATSGQVQWDSTLLGNQRADDLFYGLIIDAQGHIIGQYNATEQRSAAGAITPLDRALVTGETIYVKSFFYNPTTRTLTAQYDLNFVV